MNTSNSKEKNTITVDLTNDEKIVFSQLGINPLIKLGKEYLTSNNFVRLKDNSKKKDNSLNNTKTTTTKVKKISNSKEINEIETNVKANKNPKDKLTKNNKNNEEVSLLDGKDEIEVLNELSNARKKRRRSSASLE